METMTISQAIRKVKDIKGRIAKHQGYAVGSVLYALKSPPAYSFKGQLELSDQLNKDLLRLTMAIAVANAIGEGRRTARAHRSSKTSSGRMCWDCLRGCMAHMLSRVNP